jgi:hypothetical protein
VSVQGGRSIIKTSKIAIGDVYYVPGAWEGPKAALKPHKTAVHEMAKSRDQLKAYVAELSERSTK